MDTVKRFLATVGASFGAYVAKSGWVIVVILLVVLLLVLWSGRKDRGLFIKRTANGGMWIGLAKEPADEVASRSPSARTPLDWIRRHLGRRERWDRRQD